MRVMKNMKNPPVFCAIDTPKLKDAKALAHAVADAGCGLKLGLEFFNSRGPSGIKAVRGRSADTPLFLDLKFHDIPNTVAGAVKSVLPLKPDYINVHASGGADMMKAARDAIGGKPTKILAVTILTSLDQAAMDKIGYKTPLAERVVQLAQLAQESGMHGVVCAGSDVANLRKALGPDFILMVPGIRPAQCNIGDQKRTMTPREALEAGATHLVIGRPITEADDPEKAARDILRSIQ